MAELKRAMLDRIEKNAEERNRAGLGITLGSDAVILLCRHIRELESRATDGQRAGLPEGYVLVPAEPTPEMVDAGWQHTADPCWSEDVANAYRAMLAAAPTPQAHHQQQQHEAAQGFAGDRVPENRDFTTTTPPAGDAGQEAPEERIESLFRNRMTPYGLLVRALRIVAASSLYEMAQSTGRTPAELSAVEMGRKPATPELASLTAKFFADKGIHGTQAALMVAVEASKGEKG